MSLNNGSTPQQTVGGYKPGQKRLFHSDPEYALIKDKTIQPGYGILTVGTVMALDVVTLDLVPCAPTAHMDASPARAYGVADVANGSDEYYCTLDDAAKFKVGSELILVRNDGGSPDYHDGGAITAVDTTTERHRAKITFTNATADANFSTANMVNAYVKSGAAGKFSDAAWVLDQDVDTGTGEGALGANASVVISNAILYKNSMVGYDAAAQTALGVVEDGQHLILK